MQLLRARLISEFNQFVFNFLLRYNMTFLHSKYKLIYIYIYISYYLFSWLYSIVYLYVNLSRQNHYFIFPFRHCVNFHWLQFNWRAIVFFYGVMIPWFSDFLVSSHFVHNFFRPVTWTFLKDFFRELPLYVHESQGAHWAWNSCPYFEWV